MLSVRKTPLASYRSGTRPPFSIKSPPPCDLGDSAVTGDVDRRPAARSGCHSACFGAENDLGTPQDWVRRWLRDPRGGTNIFRSKLMHLNYHNCESLSINLACERHSRLREYLALDRDYVRRRPKQGQHVNTVDSFRSVPRDGSTHSTDRAHVTKSRTRRLVVSWTTSCKSTYRRHGWSQS